MVDRFVINLLKSIIPWYLFKWLRWLGPKSPLGPYTSLFLSILLAISIIITPALLITIIL